MADRHLPVRPNLNQLKHQAKDLLRAIKRGDADALADLRKHHPERPEPADTPLADAQFVLARSYGVASWPRLVVACRMTNAICRDDIRTVRELVQANPALLDEDARGVKGNWGPPMSYAANLGRDRIIKMLRDLGATDVQYAFDRACLQGQLETARLLYSMGARPLRGIVMGTCETLSVDGLGFLLDLGAEVCDEQGEGLAPVAMILQTYGRRPHGKHQCLELLTHHGIELPDTPPMALHRGRIDLLEAHLERDPQMLSRRFAHEEIYPPELGCHSDHSYALHATPLAGTTLLHMCVDFDEMEIAQWLLAHGADVNARAAIDADGFGGHTPLFGCVVTQPIRLRSSDEFARLLLDHGADPNVRASLRKQTRDAGDDTLYEYRDVTPLSWGERFRLRDFVSQPAMQLIAKRGGQP